MNDLSPSSWKPDETPTHIINPLTKSVTITFRNDENNPYELEVPSLEMSTYPKWQADIIIKKVVDAIINERELGIVTPESRSKLVEEVML